MTKSLLPDAPERFRSMTLTIDTEKDLGEQVLVARAAGWSWKHIETLAGKSRQYLHNLAEEAKARVFHVEQQPRKPR